MSALMDCPICWRFYCIVAPQRIKGAEKPKATTLDFDTKLAADSHKKSFLQKHGDDHVAATVTPIYPSARKQAAARRIAQDDLTLLGWPIQHVPPRAGMPTKKTRKR
jgi:hypothetical protein